MMAKIGNLFSAKNPIEEQKKNQQQIIQQALVLNNKAGVEVREAAKGKFVFSAEYFTQDINRQIQEKEAEIVDLKEASNKTSDLIREIQQEQIEIHQDQAKIDEEIFAIDLDIKSKDAEISQNEAAINDTGKLEELRKQAKFISQAVDLVKKNAPEYAELNNGEDHEALKKRAAELKIKINKLEIELEVEESKEVQVIDYSNFDKEVEEKIGSLVSEIKNRLNSFDKGINENETIAAINWLFYEQVPEATTNSYKNSYQNKDLWDNIKSKCTSLVNTAYPKISSGSDDFFSVLEGQLKGFKESSDEYNNLRTEYSAIDPEIQNSQAKDLSLFERLSKLNERSKAGYNQMLAGNTSLENSVSQDISAAQKKEKEKLNSQLLEERQSLLSINSKIELRSKFEVIVSIVVNIFIAWCR